MPLTVCAINLIRFSYSRDIIEVWYFLGLYQFFIKRYWAFSFSGRKLFQSVKPSFGSTNQSKNNLKFKSFQDFKGHFLNHEQSVQN